MFLICSLVWGISHAGAQDFGRLFGEYRGAFVLLDEARDEWIRYGVLSGSTRYSPCSTFKIANALIALEVGAIEDTELRIGWDGTRHPVADWNHDHTMRSAFRASCVWYFQEVARRVGVSAMESWVRRLEYGNCGTSGGIDRFWLDGSLAISPEEQVRFVQRLSRRDLPVSARAIDAVLDIMTVSRGKDHTYRGKTGTAGSLVEKRASHGWWVGSLRVNRRDYYFATLITGGVDPSGRNARRITEAILAELQILPDAIR